MTTGYQIVRLLTTGIEPIGEPSPSEYDLKAELNDMIANGDLLTGHYAVVSVVSREDEDV